MSRRKRRLSLPSATAPQPPVAPSRPVPPPRLQLHPDTGGGIRAGVPLTLDEVRQRYGPARSLGAGEEARLALDNQLAADGVYTLLQHTFELGQGAAPQFMGYGALQNMAQNGLLRACIETVADDMTREWMTLRGGNGSAQETGEGTADAADRLKALDEAQRRHNLQAVFHEAAELVGYEGGAFIFIDTGADGEALMTPLHLGPSGMELTSGRRLRFQVVDPVNVFPGDYNSTSPLRADYFRPRWWWVLGERVHKSRLLRLVANEVPVLLRPAYNFMGLPQAQILWDYILHFQECRAAEARLLTKFSLTVFQTNMEAELQQGGAWADLDRRVSQLVHYRSNDGVLLIDKDTENVIKLETPLSGVTDIVRQALEFLAALNRTPAVKLLGISPSGFNATGESDIRNYYDHITSQQEKVLRPAIQRALECIQLHEFREIDHGLGFDFAPLGEEDRAALATLQKTRADTVAVYLDRGVISAEEARAALVKDPDSPFADIDPEELPEAEGSEGDVPPGMEGESGNVDDVDKAGAVYDAALDAREWRTTERGKHFEVETETGEITKGNIGQAKWNSPPAQASRRAKVEDAMREIANGRPEATVRGLRNDLDQHGGTNDVTIIRGDEKKGLVHIGRRHGSASVAPVLEAVANGNIVRFVEGNKTVHIDKDGYRAVLSLEEHGKKKTWLLTGYDIVEDAKKEPTGDSGKVCTRHAATHDGPTSSRPAVGAVDSFNERIGQLLEKSNLRGSEQIF